MKIIRKILIRILRLFRSMISDESFVKILYYLHMGKKLDLKNPQTMNEKLQWLKLYDRKPLYHEMVDKILAKEYIRKLIGPQYLIPTIGQWNSFDEIDFERLPNRFVLKTNHSGGNMGVVICKDKTSFDKNAARKRLEKSLKHDIYKSYVEWPYKDIKKCIFAEELLEDNEGDLVDYKFYCFDGYVDAVLTCIDRQSGETKFYFFDKKWELKRYNKRGKEAPIDFTIPKPKNVDEMFDLAAKISKGIPHLRVDLYNIDGKIYFGEMTFFTASGFDENRLPETDMYFGSLIQLPKIAETNL